MTGVVPEYAACKRQFGSKMGRRKTSLFAQARAELADLGGMRLLPVLTIISLLPACDSTVNVEELNVAVGSPVLNAEVESVTDESKDEEPEQVKQVSDPASELPADPNPTESDDGEDDGEDADDEVDGTGHTSDDTSDGTPDEEDDAAVWAHYDCDGHAQVLYANVHLGWKLGAYDNDNDVLDVTSSYRMQVDYYDTIFEDMADYCMEVASDAWMDTQCWSLMVSEERVEIGENNPDNFDAVYSAWYDSVAPEVDGERSYPGCDA